MVNLVTAIPVVAQVAAVRTLLGLPDSAKRVLAGRPARLDGQQLALEAQLLLRLQHLVGNGMTARTVAGSRDHMRLTSRLVAGAPIGPMAVREFDLPGPASPLRARLYRPERLSPGSPLLLYFHGGGWVIGDLDTHDNLCRFLAKHAGVRVLAVDYRLAPEHRFPAAHDDALAAFRYAVAHADELEIDPTAIALGGDSAGGNLAVSTAAATVSDEQRPAFVLAFYPPSDATSRRRSRDLFADGFFLNDTEINWFIDHYQPDLAARHDPRLSVLLADDLSGLPPTYLVTAGFDPLRDEGEDLAEQLAVAGVPVVLRRHSDLFHGFANVLGAGIRCREAVFEAAGALRAGLGLGPSRRAERSLKPAR